MKTTLVTTQLMLLVPLVVLLSALPALAQAGRGTGAPSAPAPAAATPTAPAPRPGTVTLDMQGVTPPTDYVIGPEDVLSIVFWREKDLSSEAMVRPDGRISIPLLNDVQAAGLTPEQLRQKLTVEAQRFVEDPTVTVIVKAINSRKVYVTGQVSKPGVYPLTAPTTVLQLISMVGGLLEYADDQNIVIMRTENGKPANYHFNYKDVVHQKNLKQNIDLKPGDTVVVP